MNEFFIKKKSNNKFILNSEKIKIGINKITICKKSDFKAPIVKLVSNNNKSIIPHTIIDANNIEIIFEVISIMDYKIIITDGLKNMTIPLTLDSLDTKDSAVNFTIDEFYKKGKIYFKLRNQNILTTDYNINISGDLNKNVIWKKNTKDIDINFVHQVIGFKTLNFTINGIKYTKTIINPEKFPNNLIKINNGVRINTSCLYDLVLKTDIDEQIIKAGSFNANINLDNIRWMKLYFRDKLLFEQRINKDKFLPKIIITDNPLRVKLSQTYYEDVHVKIEGFENMFVIPQGDISANITLEKGLRKIVILDAMNATFDKDTFIMLVN